MTNNNSFQITLKDEWVTMISNDVESIIIPMCYDIYYVI